MLKIGLFGYGKMGRAIETIAPRQGATIAWRITRENRADVTHDLLRQADVIIEFSRPEAAFDNVMVCLEAGVPVICGTTGWADQLPAVQQFCRQHHGAFLWASNFSVGVNLFFAINRSLARLMDERSEYSPAVTETHHVHKLDAPSGTALTLVHDLIALTARSTGWALAPNPVQPGEIPVTAIREGEVPGTHSVVWTGPSDEIYLEHRAHSRAGFAAGAVLAAQWIVERRGVFTMNDVLGIR
ncbi:MAG: 4-hydroxy-tetrahydrodipicolinate reductase [Saprospiraceae bacterium]